MSGCFLGIFWATREWKKNGIIRFLSRIHAVPELDDSAEIDDEISSHNDRLIVPGERIGPFYLGMPAKVLLATLVQFQFVASIHKIQINKQFLRIAPFSFWLFDDKISQIAVEQDSSYSINGVLRVGQNLSAFNAYYRTTFVYDPPENYTWWSDVVKGLSLDLYEEENEDDEVDEDGRVERIFVFEEK